MAQMLFDDFTAADGTLLDGRKPTSHIYNFAWFPVAIFGATLNTSAASISNNSLIITSNDNGCLIDAACTDGEFMFDWTPAVGVLNRCSLFFRSKKDASAYMRVFFREDNGDIAIRNGATIITSTSFSFVEGTTYAFRVVVDGTSCEVFVDDVSALTATIPASDPANRYAGFVRATGSDLTKVDNFVVTSSQPLSQFGTVDSLVPASTATIRHDGRHYCFFSQGGDLFCAFGSDTDNLSLTETNGATNLQNIGNNGKSFSIVQGDVSGTSYAFGLISRKYPSALMTVYRWELSASGIESPTVLLAESATSSADTTAFLTRNYGAGDVTDLLATVQTYGGNCFVRSMDVNLAASQNEGTVNPPQDFPEHHRMFELSDGYLLFGIDAGQSSTSYTGDGIAFERTKATLGAAWSAGNAVQTTGPGSFADQSYAVDSSHIGQQGLAQTDDGVIWCCYVNDDDKTKGNYGKVILRKRGSTIAGTWSTVSLDAANASARHVGIQSDGTDIWIYWIAEDSGNFGQSILVRKYTVANDTLGATETVYTAPGTDRLSRMSLGSRMVDSATAIVANGTSNKLHVADYHSITTDSPIYSGVNMLVGIG